MARQRKEKTLLVSFRATQRMISMLDKRAEEMRACMSGANIGRADVIRFCVLSVLGSLTDEERCGSDASEEDR